MAGDTAAAPAYRSFWDDVGETFPSLKGAPSTAYYAECERTLCTDFFPGLAGRRLLKSDLWDEAKNTEILYWAADRGAQTFGIDIALSTAAEARATALDRRPRCSVSDIRSLPFRSDSFDLIYSMGTIEHFPDFPTAVAEMFRVLKPGGCAIIGVPNKLDPFLRPLMVHFMNTWNAYGYGMEKSFTPGELRRLLTGAGFQVVGLSGILFMPGWLRMADLWCHVHAPTLTAVTGALVAPFAWAYRHIPAVRRHGYLIACAATKP
jgi:SAM-dependent methyltransferase